MKRNRVQSILSFLLIFGLLSGFAFSDEVADPANDYAFDVVWIHDETTEGKLALTSERITFVAGEASYDWAYEELSRIKLKHRRFMEIELSTGEKYKIAPVGEYSFDRKFANFLRNTFPAAEIEL